MRICCTARVIAAFLICATVAALHAPPAIAANISIVQMGQFDNLNNGSIDVDAGHGHNLKTDGTVRCNVFLDGPIEQGDLARLNELLGQQRKRDFTKVPRLCLNSPGGSYAEGLAIAEWLMTNGVGTAVPKNASCYSACAIIFMGGSYPWKGQLNRMLHVTGTLGFHAPYIPDRNDGRRTKVDERQVGAAFSEGIRAMSAFLKLGVGNRVKRITPELMQEMVDKGPSEFFLIDTIGKTIRFRIQPYGIVRPPLVDATSVCHACVNMNYGAYERYGDKGDIALCKGAPDARRQPFPKGVRLTNDVAPRGGACSVDVIKGSRGTRRWMFVQDERDGFGNGLELGHWYLFSPSTQLASLSSGKTVRERGRQPSRRDDGKTSSGNAGPLEDEVSRERDELVRRLLDFVVVEYLGEGRADHENTAAIYADRVDYYGRAKLKRSAVMRDKANYYRRWPQRRYRFVQGSLKAQPFGDGVRITFRHRFRVSDGRRTRKGIGETTLGIVRQNERFLIASEAGRVINRE